MTRRFLASGVLLLGLLAVPARAAQDNVLLYPPDLTLSLEEKIKVFGYRPEKGTPDNVTVNGNPRLPRRRGRRSPEGSTSCTRGSTWCRPSGRPSGCSSCGTPGWSS